jgi:hypothetical protein
LTRPIILAGETQRTYAKRCIDAAKPMSVVSVKDPTRTNLQNAKHWAMLDDIANQCRWFGTKLSDNDWKLLFMDHLNSEMRLVPNMNNNGFVNLGRSSSKISVGEMSDLIELMYKHGAETGVVWTEKDKG